MVSMATAVIYCRTSTLKQKDAETITAQLTRTQRLVERHGLELLPYGPQKNGVIIDDGCTGSLLEGRAFSRFIDDLKAKKTRPDFLVVFSLSRINRLDKSSRSEEAIERSHLDNGKIKAALLNSKIKVIDEEGINDPNTVMFDLKATLAVEQYKLIRSQTMAGKTQKLSDGKRTCGGRAPYGYEHAPLNGRDGKGGWTLAPHPVDAPNLLKVLGWYVQGGAAHAARQAVEAGIPVPSTGTTRKSKSTGWHTSAVQLFVARIGIYLGEQTVKHDGIEYVLKHPALIDRRLYDQVKLRAKLKTLKRRASMLSTGFCMCECGEPIHVHNSHDRHYAGCASRCGSMPEALLSGPLWLACVCRLIQITQAEKGKPRKGDDLAAEIKVSKAKLVKVQEGIAKLLDLYLGGLEKSVWKTRNDLLNDQRATVLDEIASLEAQKISDETKKVAEDTIEGRVRILLNEMIKGPLTLDRKREVMSDLLQSDKVLVRWSKKRSGREMSEHVVLTFPTWGSLGPVSVRSTGDVWATLLGGLASGVYASGSGGGSIPKEVWSQLRKMASSSP